VERARVGKGGEQMALDPPSWGDEPRKGGTGIYFLDHFAFFAARRRLLVWPDAALPQVPRGGRRTPDPPAPHAPPRAVARYVTRRMPVVRRSLGMIEHIMDIAESRGARVVLVEAPVSPAFTALKRSDHDVFVKEMNRLAAAHDTELWQFTKEAGITRDDF